MRKFTCPQCGGRLYFENYFCGRCGTPIAFNPLTQSFERLRAEDSCLACGNREYGACNWRKDWPRDAFCRSCRLNRIIPRLDADRNLELWRRLEIAKRRVLYDLERLGLTVPMRGTAPHLGLAFDFLSEEDQQVITGHDSGLITINVAEADDARREQVRTALGEPYRTLVGHFRHECGHYLWDRFVAGTSELGQFRATFGDERLDYGQALQRYYARPPDSNWRRCFVSAYSAAHPWEDWAESVAHYLHIVSTVDTFASSPLSAGALTKPVCDPYRNTDFDAVLSLWFPIAESLNELNRSMGLSDPYPFVLSDTAIEKMQLVQQILHRAMDADAPRAVAARVDDDALAGAQR